MVQIVCDNPAAHPLIERLLAILESEGSVQAPELQVVQQGASLSLRTSEATAPSHVMLGLPLSCAVPVDAFELGVDGDEFRIEATAHDLSSLRRELLELTVELFNLLGKLSDHRDHWPAWAFRDEPAILAALSGFNSYFGTCVDKLRAGEAESMWVETFIKSRAIRVPPAPGADPTPLLMPVMDYANHHGKARGFARQEENRVDQLLLINSRDQVATDQAVVNYNAHNDLIDMYLGYGFLDRTLNSSFVRSAPFSIQVTAIGKLNVLAQAAAPFRGKLAPQNRDLRRWLPRIRKSEESFDISHLLIPCEHSMLALKRALGLTLRTCAPAASNKELLDGLELMESTALQDTRTFYERLREMAEKPQSNQTDLAALDDLRQLCDAQLEKLGNYAPPSPPPR